MKPLYVIPILLIAFVLTLVFVNARNNQFKEPKSRIERPVETVVHEKPSLAEGKDSLTNAQAFVAVITFDTRAMTKFNEDQMMVCGIGILLWGYSAFSLVTSFILKLIELTGKSITSAIHGHPPTKSR